MAILQAGLFSLFIGLLIGVVCGLVIKDRFTAFITAMALTGLFGLLVMFLIAK